MLTNPAFIKCKEKLLEQPKKWLVTGAAGFIGSHLVEALLKLEQNVVGIDNFTTGKRSNLHQVATIVGSKLWKNFKFIEGDIRDFGFCKFITKNIEVVLHQAAIASVPLSLEDPLTTNATNVMGFLNILIASQQNLIAKLVYASSSAVYGDDLSKFKNENKLGKPLSPYAVSKLTDELYATALADNYKIPLIGLRYFNIFGARQDPKGAYAAVIPKWIDTFLKQEAPHVYGDGSTTRDFCYIDNVVQANLLAALAHLPEGNHVFNVGSGEPTSLNELFNTLKHKLLDMIPSIKNIQPLYEPFRDGDIKDSLADISLAKNQLNYLPLIGLAEGLKQLTMSLEKSH